MTFAVAMAIAQIWLSSSIKGFEAAKLGLGLLWLVFAIVLKFDGL